MALPLSILGIACMIFGTIALATEQTFISETFWAQLTATNATSHDVFHIQVGLRAMVVDRCWGATDRGSACPMPDVYTFDGNSCSTASALLGAVCNICSSVASSEAQGAILSCLGKFASIISMVRHYSTSLKGMHAPFYSYARNILTSTIVCDINWLCSLSSLFNLSFFIM